MPKSVFTAAYASFVETMIASRRDAGLSQIELGARIGRTQSWVSSYERGVRRIDLIEFAAIAVAMGYEPTDLFAKVAAKLPRQTTV